MVNSKGQGKELPTGWCWVKHKDIAQINPKFPSNNIPDDLIVSFLPMSSVKEGSGKFELSLSRQYGEVKKGYTPFIDGDLIFAKITPCMENGKIAVLSGLVNGMGFGSTEFHVSRVTDLSSRKFLFFYLVQEKFKREARKRMTGSAGQLRVPKSYFEDVFIPLPPLPEQHRIVAKIEDLFSDLDAGIENLKTAQAQLKIYRQSVLKWAFEGKLTAKWRKDKKQKGELKSADELLTQIKAEREKQYNSQLKEWEEAVKTWETVGKTGKKPTKPQKPKEIEPLSKSELAELPELPEEWVWVRFGELISSIRGGTTSVPIDTPTIYPILRSSSVRGCKIDYFDVRFLKPEQIKNQDDFLSVNDLLFTRLNGTIEYVGNCARVTEQLSSIFLYPDRLYCVKLINNDIQKYVELAFASPILRRLIESKAKSTAGHKRISISDIVEIPFPLPNNTEAWVAVLDLEEKLSLVESLEATIIENLQRSEALR